MPTAHPILQPFLHYLQFEKRYSPHTVLAYQTDLISFFDFLQTDFDGLELSQITHTHVRTWLAHLKQEGKTTARTLNRKISSLRAFFKFQLKTGVLAQSPMGKIVAPKTEKRLPQFVAQKDTEKLFTQIEFSDDWDGHTDRLLLSLFYQTGMRLSEVLGLTAASIDAANGSIRVWGKGGKERIIPAGKDLLGIIKEYEHLKGVTFTGPVASNLLVNARGKAIGPRDAYNRVHRHLSAITTIEKRSPHVLRHTFATHLANAGADLNAVKELLGHSSLAATQVYTHNTIDRLRDIYKKAHPKA